MKHQNTIFSTISIWILAVTAKSIQPLEINILLQISVIPIFYILATIIIYRTQDHWTTLLWSAPILIYLLKDLCLFILGFALLIYTYFPYKS